MKNEKAKKHSSPKLQALMDEIRPLQMEQTRVRMQLAARIEDAMKKRGFKNQLAFAEAMKKQPSEISKWLSGTHNFTVDTLVEISKALNVELSYLLGQEQVQVVYRQSYEIRVDADTYFQPAIKLRTPLEYGILIAGIITASERRESVRSFPPAFGGFSSALKS